MEGKTILVVSVIAVLLIGVISFDDAFAQKEPKPPKEPKTFESECAKKLDKDKLNLDGLFCEAIINIQIMLDMIKASIVDLQAKDMALMDKDMELMDEDASLQSDIDAHILDDDDLDSTNELQTLSGTGSVDLSNGGGTVSCISITGGAGLCDGNDAVVDADSSTTNEIQTLSISGQDLTISGANTVTLPSDSAPQAFHLKGTSTSSGNTAVSGLSKTFTLSEATIVFVSSDVETEYSTLAGQFVRAEIEIDGSVVSFGPFLDDDATALMFFPAHVSWTGQLSAGTHTISTRVNAVSGGTVCPNFGVGCNMNILVLGQ